MLNKFSSKFRLTFAVFALSMSVLHCSAQDRNAAITFESLLRDMSDLGSIARFPSPAYRQLQASSYNRQSTRRDQPDQGTGGWFADSDGLGYIREEKNQGQSEWVIMEHNGPGCLTKFWTPYFYRDFGNRVGPNIRVYLDGAETPVIDECFIELLTGNDWPASYGATPPRKNGFAPAPPFAQFTARAGNFFLPIPFARSCKVTLTQPVFYNIVNYRAYPAGTEVKSFSMEQYKAAAPLLAEVAQSLRMPPNFAHGRQVQESGEIPAGESANLQLPPGPAAVRNLELQVDLVQVKANPGLLRSTVLKIEFDGQETVWCPVGDFFGSANAINPFHSWTRTVSADGRLICRWTMPYQKTAMVSILNLGQQPVTGSLLVHVDDWEWDDRSMHFFARWRGDEIIPGNRFVDWNFVDVRGRGMFVGDTWTVLNRTGGWWGEGDEKIYVDDSYDQSKFPDHFGTGTEDYYGWAGGVNPTKDDKFDTPFLANISVGSTAENSTRGFNVCSRIRSLDAIPFESRFVFDMEASPGVDQRNAWDLLCYSVVTNFYALPGAQTNRPALPEAAVKPIVSLADLNRRSEELSGVGGKKQVAGAIECESLKVSSSTGVEAYSQFPAPNFKPEERLSDGAHLFVHFKQPGESLDLKLTEQFQPKLMNLHVSKCYDFGIVNLWVNGVKVKENIDLYAPDLEVESINLGVVEPVDNAIQIRLELAAKNPRSRGAQTLAGLDCIELKEVK